MSYLTVEETGGNACGDCGREMEQTVLTTGTYIMCVPCQDKLIERNMTRLRSELRAKGYEI